MGIIRQINSYEETLTVEYDEHRLVTYPFQLLEELELAYAITIHKSQGSEYPAVVIPLLQGPRQLYHRNLLYTAVTRARKCVTLVGSDAVFREMIATQRSGTAIPAWPNGSGNLSEKDKNIFSEVAVAGGVPFLRPGFLAGDLPFLQEEDQPACGGGAPVYEVRSASCRE